MATPRQALSDDELRAVFLSGDESLLDKLSAEELQRGVALFEAKSDPEPSKLKPPSPLQSAVSQRTATRAKGLSQLVKAAEPAALKVAEAGGPHAAMARFGIGAAKGVGQIGLKALDFLAGGSTPGEAELRTAQKRRRKRLSQTPEPASISLQQALEDRRQNEGLTGIAKRSGLLLAREAAGRPGSVSRAIIENPRVVDDMATEMGTQMAASYLEFVADPEGQAKERPLEFIANAADLFGFGVGVSKAVNVAPEMIRGVRAAAKAADEAGDALKASVDMADEALRMQRKSDLAEVAGDTEQAREARRIRDEFQRQSKELEAKGHSEGRRLSPPESGDLARPGQAAAPSPDLPPATGPSTEAGRARAGLLARLAGTGAGANIGNAIATRNDDRIFSPVGSFMGAVGGFTFIRAIESAAVRSAIGEFLKGSTDRALLPGQAPRIGKASLERILDTVVTPLLPDTPRTITEASRGRARAGAALAGGALGGIGGAAPKEGEIEPLRGLGAAAVGAAFGAGAVGRPLGRSLKVGETYPSLRQIWKRWILRDGGLPQALADLKRGQKTAMMAATFEALDAAEEFSRFSRRDREYAFQVMIGERDWGGLLSYNADLHEVALRNRNAWDRQTLALIDEGIAQGTIAERMRGNYGTYLPRLPHKYYSEDDTMEFVATELHRHGDNLGRMSDQNYLKSRYENRWRKEVEKLKAERDRLQEVRAATRDTEPKVEIGSQIDRLERKIESTERKIERFVQWAEENRVRDLPTLTQERFVVTQQDLFVARYQNAISAMPEYTLSQQITDALDAGDDAVAALSGRLPRKLTGPGGRDHVEYMGKMFRRLPDHKRFGSLRNRFVDETVAYDIEGVHDMAQQTNRLLDTVLRGFKIGKVPANPASLMRNFYGQIPLNDMGGLGPIKGLKTYVEAAIDFNKQGPIWQEAGRAGAIGGEFVGTEIQPFLRSLESGDSVWTATRKMVEWAGTQPLDRMIAAHQATEQFFKLSMYHHARKLGMSMSDAARHAQRWVFDYSDVPKMVHVVRKAWWGAPFISFSYKALPRVFESMVAIRNPRQMLRFWKYPIAMAAASEAAAWKHGFRTEEEKQFWPTVSRVMRNALFIGTGGIAGDGVDYQRYLPEWAGSQQLLSPAVDSLGRIGFYDLTWMTPWGDFGEFGKGTAGQVLKEIGITDKFPRFLEPGNPYLHTGLAFTGYDLFLGRPIVSADRQFEPLHGSMEFLNFVARTWMPPLTPGVGHAAIKIEKSGAEKMARLSLAGAFAGSSIPGGRITRTAGAVAGGAAGFLLGNASTPEATKTVDPYVPTARGAIKSELLGFKRRPVVPRREIARRIFLLSERIDDLLAQKRRLKRRGIDPEGDRITDLDSKIKELRAERKQLREEKTKVPREPALFLEAERRLKAKRK